MSRFIFVYGTLKRGFGNHKHHLSDATFVGKGVTVAPLFVMKDTGGFPVVFHEHDMPGHPASVLGEVFEVTDKHIRTMDRLEGNGHMFVRTKETVELDDGSRTEAEIYLGVPAYWKDYATTFPPAPVTNGAYSWRDSHA